jgi:hypothetical protein
MVTVILISSTRGIEALSAQLSSKRMVTGRLMMIEGPEDLGCRYQDGAGKGWWGFKLLK